MRARPLVVGAFLLFSAGGAAAERASADLLVSGGTVVTMDAAGTIVEQGAVAIRAGRIVEVGPAASLGARYRASRRVSADGAIVLPGLVNAHNHAPMVLFRGMADDLALMEWLEKYVFPVEKRHVDADFVRWGTRLACLEMIRSGTTTYADMYYFEDVMAEVTDAAGMRAVLGETILGFPTPDSRNAQEALAYTERFIQRWRGSSRIVPAVAPHATFTNSAETLKAAKALADRYAVPFLIHLSETADEERQIRSSHGKSSTGWLESLGVLGGRVLGNHGVHLSEEDMAILRRRGAAISHNPESNMKLSSGTAPILRLLELGIPVGLGTDGAASNNNLDMFQAMDFAAKLHKHASGRPTALPAREVLAMATSGGARALGLPEVGTLEAGNRADLIVVDARASHGVPLYNVYSHLVYALRGSDVRTTIIDGRVVMLERRVLTLDEPAILKKAAEYQRRIAASLGK